MITLALVLGNLTTRIIFWNVNSRPRYLGLLLGIHTYYTICYIFGGAAFALQCLKIALWPLAVVLSLIYLAMYIIALGCIVAIAFMLYTICTTSLSLL